VDVVVLAMHHQCDERLLLCDAVPRLRARKSPQDAECERLVGARVLLPWGYLQWSFCVRYECQDVAYEKSPLIAVSVVFLSLVVCFVVP
jgi:hypothetical protein